MDWDIIVSMNTHWERNFFYEYKFERDALKKLKQRRKLICLIIGPRRVGKTVLMKQVINDLIKKGVERKKILYLLLEKEVDDIRKTILMWSKEAGVDLKKETFVFLDEIQYINEWGKQVKYLYDIFPNMRIYLSGSASALLRKGSESLAGRLVEMYVPPLSFKEYFTFSGRMKTKSWKEYKRYMLKQLPEIAMGEDQVEYIKTIVDKVIREDLRILFEAPDTDLAESLVRIVFKKPGQIIDYIDLANELGVDRNTISKYMNALTNALIFKKVYNYSTNPRKTEKRKKKFYPFYNTLVNYVWPSIPEESLQLETEAFEKLNASYYYREGNKEIDIILERCRYGVEVKTGKRITRTDLKTILSADWIKKRFLLCTPESNVLVSRIHKIYPNMLNDVQQDCQKHAE